MAARDDRRHENELAEVHPNAEDDSLAREFDAFVAQFESASFRAAVARGFRATPKEMGAAAVAAAAEAAGSPEAKPSPKAEPGH